jgi:PilZ domain
MFLKRNFDRDRRRRKRQLFNTSIRVFTESGSIEALGINISDVGMSLFTIANLPVDSQIQVEFLPSRSTEPTRVWGTVRHRALYLYGIEFLAGSDQHPVSRAGAQSPDDLTLDVASS